MGTITAKSRGPECKVQQGVPSAGLRIPTAGIPLVAAPAMRASAVQQAHWTLLPKGFTCSMSLQGAVIECACKCVNMQCTAVTLCA